METRPFTPDDVAALEAFLDRIPKGESTFFKEDITADGIVRQWAADTAARRTLAWDGDQVIGYAAVIPGVGCPATSGTFGWSSIPSGEGPASATSWPAGR